ncbi:PEGA domain-containing protein [Candidatus Cryosericum septentrionale]|nr:PEGA domain-containing protein [Candidatus Cryosericum septentrionale]
MSERHSHEPDRIDELLGSLHESRTAQAPAGASVLPPAPQRPRRSRIWIVFVLVAAVAAAVVFLLLQGRAASLNIRSFPSGATVFLDEQQVGTTPLVLPHVTPGTHAIQIRVSGWDVWNGTTTAVRGSTTQVIANMTHAAYSLVVTSTPRGARVALDGATKGVTPLTLIDLKPRNYALVVSLKGYAAISRTVDLSDATQSTQDFSLVQAFGKLSVVSDPTGAQVIIDGKSHGVTPLKIDSLPVGDYALTLKLDGGTDITDTLSVKEGIVLTKRYKFDLTLGGLAVSTDPAGASITIDGQATSHITPFTFSTLKEGTHVVELELPGYLPWSDEVSMPKGQTTRLSIALTKLY